MINKTEVIDFTRENDTWSVLPLQDNIEFLTKLGLFKNGNMKDKSVFIKNGQKFVMKQNSFHPHTKDDKGIPIEKLDISTAVNEYALTKLIENISDNTPEFANLKNLYAPVALLTIVSMSTKGTKANTKAVSSTPLYEDYYPQNILKAFNPTLLQEMEEKFKLEPPQDAKLVASLIGRKLTTGDVLFNIDGDVKIIDLGDASPKLVMENFNDRFIRSLKKKSIEDAKADIERMLTLLTAAIEQTDKTISDVYSIYQKINIEFNPQENSRTSGMRLYQKIWMHIIPELNMLLNDIEEGKENLFDKTLNVDYTQLITLKQMRTGSFSKLKVAKENEAKRRTSVTPNKQSLKQGLKTLEETFKLPTPVINNVTEDDEDFSTKSKSFNAFEDDEDTDVLDTIKALNETLIPSDKEDNADLIESNEALEENNIHI